MSEQNWRIGHLDNLGSPWGNAGGVVKTIEDVERMALTGVGWIEAGSYTLEKRLGNQRDAETGEFIIDPDTSEPVRVYYHNPQTGETYNSLGMPNNGIDEVEREIPEMARIAETHNKRLVVNVAPVSNEPVAETQELVARAYEAGAHAVIVNGGCPNVVTEDGGRHEILSTHPRSLSLVLRGLRPIVEKFQPVFLRTSPNETYDDTKNVLSVVKESGVVSALYQPNAFNVELPLGENGKQVLGVKGKTGGKSGPTMVKEAREQTKWAVKALDGSGIDVVSSCSVANAKELKIRLGLRAVAAAGTTFYYESGDWGEDTDRLLRGLAA